MEFLNEVETKARPKNRDELKKIIEDTIEAEGYNCDLNFIDTSLITDMSGLFAFSKFNGDISKWNVSKVVIMEEMFAHSKFNGDISKWNVSKVTHMGAMFWDSKFDKDISRWDVSKVRYHTDMFGRCPLENKPEFQPKFSD